MVSGGRQLKNSNIKQLIAMVTFTIIYLTVCLWGLSLTITSAEAMGMGFVEILLAGNIYLLFYIKFKE